MNIRTGVTVSLLGLAIGAGSASAAPPAPAGRALVGEVRALAIGSGNGDEIAKLHHDGWLEARGQLLSTEAFPELFSVVGRTWTADDMAAGRFAVPTISDHASQMSSDNPYGVLGPGDLVRSARRAKSSGGRGAPLSYWIFVGRDVSGIEAAPVAR